MQTCDLMTSEECTILFYANRGWEQCKTRLSIACGSELSPWTKFCHCARPLWFILVSFFRFLFCLSRLSLDSCRGPNVKFRGSLVALTTPHICQRGLVCIFGQGPIKSHEQDSESMLANSATNKFWERLAPHLIHDSRQIRNRVWFLQSQMRTFENVTLRARRRLHVRIFWRGFLSFSGCFEGGFSCF